MKRVIIILIMLSDIFAEENIPSSKEILERAVNIISPKNFIAEMNMNYLRSDGTTAQYKMLLRSKNYTRSHITFIAPERERDRQVLRIDDNLWTYMPKTKKVILISFDSDFMGGDFSNQDIVRLNLLDDYKPEFFKITDKQYILDLTPAGKGFLYSKIRYWVRKQDNMPIQAIYFSRNNNPLKKLVYKDIKDFGGFIRPSLYEMINLAENTKTYIAFDSFKRVDQLQDQVFYKENLGK